MKKYLIIFTLMITASYSYAQNSISQTLYGDEINLMISNGTALLDEEKQATFTSQVNPILNTLYNGMETVLSSEFTPEEQQMIITFYNSTAGQKIKARSLENTIQIDELLQQFEEEVNTILHNLH